MALVPRRLTLPRLPDEVRELDKELFRYLVDLNKQLNRMYDDLYRGIKNVEDQIP